MVRTAIVGLALLGCRHPVADDPATPAPTTPTESPEEAFDRPVVLAARPLALDNPQREVVSWPLWGAAFSLVEPVSFRATLEPGGKGTSGIVIAGPGSPRARSAVSLLSIDGSWWLRETDGGEPVQDDVALQGAMDGAVVRIDDERVTIGNTSLMLSAPLGDEAGLYVTLDPGATLGIGELALTQVLPAHPDLGDPLRELAADRGIDIGSATDVWPPLFDLGFDGLFGEQFGAASPTEFYWPTTRGEDRDWNFLPADLMVNYATVRDQRVTGMFLVWDFQLPRWVIDVANDEGPAALGAVFDEHVTTVVGRYRGQVDRWVVVNEAIWGPGEAGNPHARFAQTLWSDFLGVAYIERAFQLARAADPDAVLLYNETGAEALSEKSDFLYGMASDLVGRAVPIDGIGLQFHVDAANPPDMDDVRANLARFGALGLDVYITELDVSLANTGLSEADGLALQAGIYADVVSACLAVPACRSTTVFGFSDRYAWDELGDATPLLFDEDYVAKPAFYAVQSALSAR